MKPGPYYSKDIKRLGILGNHNTVYGCDLINIDYDIKTIYELLSDNYYVMVESMICFDHWCNLLAYITNNSFDREKQYLLLYDPYYNQLKMISVDEFESVWLSGQHEKIIYSKILLLLNDEYRLIKRVRKIMRTLFM